MPRLLISLILLLTGLAGFLTSFLLLRLGVIEMWLRYPAAILVAYAVFLLLLRLWLSLLRSRKRVPDLVSDVVDSAVDIGVPDSTSHGEDLTFGGGDAGGGGAGGSWGESTSSVSVFDGRSPSSDSVFDLDLEEGWLVVIAVVAIVGGLIASLYIVYIAPALLAEILVDGVLVAGLYKRVKRIEQRHWLQTAVRRTLAPALIVALFLTVAGFAMQKFVPDAHSIGDIWKHYAKRDSK